ncbi:MAG TPA: hypothetical protein VD927_03420 [Chryseosolibacter sp.]|nr:hypothetical protein [Chryseosolibacter sp.]
MCNFSFPFSGSAESVLDRARNAVQSQGGTFAGDDASGAFEVSVFGSAIKGSYQVSGKVLMIKIDSKPFIVPCSTIEGFLKNQIR